MLLRLFIACWERADLLALVGDVFCVFVSFPCGILGQLWYLFVSFPGLCHHSYFYKSKSIHSVLLFELQVFLSRQPACTQGQSQLYPFNSTGHEN